MTFAPTAYTRLGAHDCSGSPQSGVGAGKWEVGPRRDTHTGGAELRGVRATVISADR